MRQLLFRVRALQSGGGSGGGSGGAPPATKEEVDGMVQARGKRNEAKQKRRVQLNRKCDLKSARCFCEGCAPLKGDATGQIHCFHCQCEGYPKAECEFDANTLKGQEASGGWLW